MSRVINITIEDGYENRVLDNFALALNWTHPDGYGFDGYYDEKADFLKNKLTNYVIDCVKVAEQQTYSEQAKAAVNQAESDLVQAKADFDAAKETLNDARSQYVSDMTSFTFDEPDIT